MRVVQRGDEGEGHRDPERARGEDQQMRAPVLGVHERHDSEGRRGEHDEDDEQGDRDRRACAKSTRLVRVWAIAVNATSISW
jgi:hypothetical protein